MITQQLLDFVKQQSALGVSREAITNMLIGQGWSATDVSQVFSTLAPTQPAQPAIINLQPNPVPIGVQPNPQVIRTPAAAPIASTPTIHYAGFWSRLVAALIDGVLMNIVLGIITVAAGLLNANATIFNLVPWLLSLIAMVYYIFCEASAAQATIGKRIVGIKVTDYSGGRISLGRSVGRTLAKNVSALIFFIGFLMVGFTAKKQGLHDMMAKTLVVKYKHSSLGKLLLIMLIALVILIVGGGLLIYDVFIPRILGSITNVMSNPQQIVEALNNASSSDTTAPAPIAAFTAVSVAEYQTDLKQALSGFPIEGSTATNAGPALLSFDSLFITVDMPPIPNLTYNEAISITIDKILDSKGKNIDNPNSDFETDPFFRKVSMEESDDPVPHYEGNRNLNVLSGSFSSDAKSIQGTLELNLPVGLKILNLTQADIGKPQSVVFNGKASKLTLKTLDDQSVAIDCNSSDDCLGDIQGVDDQGGLISNDGLNSNTNATDDGSREYSAHFGSNISGVAVYVPADSFTASYPFNLTVGQNNVPASNSSASQGATSQSTGSQSPSSQGQVSAADRSAIIQAILNMEQVMATKDPAQIRAYLEKDLSNSSDSATELSQIKNAPDSEILLASAAINLEQVTGTQLESPSTQITLSSDGNTATVIITSGNSKTTLKINKVNGIWY